MPKYSVKKPFTILVAVILVLVLGFVSLTGIQTDLLPAMNLPYLLVMTTYPGASPEQVEADVTQPLENALSVLNGVKNVTSQSNENYSLIFLEYQDDTDMDGQGQHGREPAGQRPSGYGVHSDAYGNQP